MPLVKMAIESRQMIFVIGVGDAGLYVLTRCAGRGWFERSSLRRFSAKVAESERWFAERGTPILIFSRLVPGARLPTYHAAGFLRVPLPRFLFVTGAASCLWTMAILFLAQTFGERLTSWLGTYKHAGLMLFVAGLILLAVLQLLRRAFASFNFRRFTDRLARWQHWEFWPASMFYQPVAIYCLWLAVKYRGLTLPTAANPGILSGGMVGESKNATLQELQATSPEFTAEAELVVGDSAETSLRSLDEICARLNVSFPFILKPDVGQRGVGVKLIRLREQADRQRIISAKHPRRLLLNITHMARTKPEFFITAFLTNRKVASSPLRKRFFQSSLATVATLLAN